MLNNPKITTPVLLVRAEWSVCRHHSTLAANQVMLLLRLLRLEKTSRMTVRAELQTLLVASDILHPYQHPFNHVDILHEWTTSVFNRRSPNIFYYVAIAGWS
mmetsp:Transcript_10044/g.15199  ORF Transcript_10044/g.15199 Transcript_10044/m.15199 type:complete len:102 (+) Transcript_10044:572-877(+)